MSDERQRWLRSLAENARQSQANWWMTFVLSSLFGYFGADRFYLNSPVLGFFKLCTFGGLGFWWIADLILLLANQMRDDNGCIVSRPF